METERSTDEKLVEAYKLGDEKALATLVKRWHKSFCDKAYWMVKDKDAAKDIAQESWATIIGKIDTLNEPKQFKYWALRIVCNKSTDWLRLLAKKRNNTVSYNIEIKDDSTNYSENEPLKKVLIDSIHKLPADQKMVIRLFYIESYSLKQISDLLDISVGTAKSRLFHAREKLKTILKYRNRA